MLPPPLHLILQHSFQRLRLLRDEVRLFAGHPISRRDYWKIRLRRIQVKRISSFPYLSGDGFAALCDYWAFGKTGTSKIDRKKLAGANSIFVKADLLEGFIAEYGSEIRASVIVSGNSDLNWNEMPSLPPSVRLWLAQNSALKHPLVKTLPIGLENIRHGRSGLPQYFREVNVKKIENKVLVPPMRMTNSARPESILESRRHPEIFDVFENYLPAEKYFELATTYKFVLCLEGNGYEPGHRLWETLYQGNFPVLLASKWQESLEYLGLPIFVVENLGDVTVEKLNKFIRKNSTFSPKDTACLWLPHWEKIISEATFRGESSIESLSKTLS